MSDLDALEAVAQAATQNDWQVLDSIHGDPIVHEVGRGILSGGGIATAFHRDDYGRANAAYIATFDPPTVLALIAELRDSRARIAEVEAERDEATEGRRAASAEVHRLNPLLNAERAKSAALAEVVEAAEKQAERWLSWPNGHDANGPQDYGRALLASMKDAAPTPPAEAERCPDCAGVPAPRNELPCATCTYTPPTTDAEARDDGTPD